MISVSVIICAHNPRPDYLRRVLEALRNQSLPLSDWELLLVDNASKEPLRAAWDFSWHPNARHIFEEKLGLARARQRGISEAVADLLTFVDDDNVLDPDYLTLTTRIGRDWPKLGVWGSGNITPEFEIEPPSNLTDLLRYLALRQGDKVFWSNVPHCIPATPWGAGLCARAAVARAYCRMHERSVIHLSGRTDNSSLAGEDLEIGFTACAEGLGTATFPELKVTHLIPKQRISRDHLLKIYEGAVTSGHLLDYKWRAITPQNPYTIKGLLAIFANALFLRGTDRDMYFVQKKAAHKALKIIREASRPP